jgi:RHH-type transcriptional regulator, proline utilization regulon repressor / proline dehydrogenase / delta 1-pyrroline-5-carboxylate dehydrogenase
MEQNSAEIDVAIRRKGEEIFKLIEDDSKSIFNKDWWYGRIMDWSMKNEKFKVQMFRFVDVLPYLNSSGEVARHLKEYFADLGDDTSGILSFGLGVGSFAPGIMASAIRKNVTQMARMFITGENAEDALPVLRKARENSLCFTVDILGEATLSEKEAIEYQSRYVDLINWLCKDSAKWPDIVQIDSDEQGPIPKVNISVKLTALYSQVSDKAWDDTVKILKERLRPIFSLARERQAFVNVDMEQYRYKDLTLQVFQELLLEPEFKDYKHFGIVIQAYLRDSLRDTEKLIAFAKARGTSITIRLVKGAYWDYETINADQMGWPIPVYTNKKESDHNYERCAELMLRSFPHIRLAAGTHNVRSMAAVMMAAEKLGLDRRAFELQMLYGMADPIKRALVKQGYRVREYATIGELIPGMAYLVRRLLENTSNESFLRSKFAENVSPEVLLKNPGVDMNVTSSKAAVQPHRFYNEPLVDFTVATNRTEMLAALKKARSRFGESIKPMIDGREVTPAKTTHSSELRRENPSKVSETVGVIHLAGTREADLALESAKKSFVDWRTKPAIERALVLKNLAAIFRRERFNLIALEVFEVGKTWTEADGDVAEAIDFCEFYAREAERLAPGEKVSFVMGEDSRYQYIPRGVSLVIAPWNFPLAILCGQVVASIVTGNTCLMKPAEQSSLIAARLMKHLLEAGCPKGVVQFLPGLGEEIGRYLVAHKDVSTISFTGSRAVGLEISKQAAVVHPGQNFVKRCIIEMGGKNAVIVDSDADLDEAVTGVLNSAFGFQGQKCSACSRAIVLEENYERFLGRLVEAAKSVYVRAADDPHAFMGPVVDEEAYQRIVNTIQKAKTSARLVYQGETPEGGYFIGPTIFADVKADSELAQEEIFGPVLAIIKARDLDEAIRFANSTAYALTGGFYSRSPANIARVRDEFMCGNLYINRGITGAMVGRHPFGGFRLSGLGSKTGGPDYLQHYMDPRVVTENMIRRGFC